MSVDSGGGSTEGWRTAGVPGGTGRHVLASLQETYAAYLFDYCEGILQDRAAAAEAVWRALIVADAQIGELRDPDRLPAWLYCLARRQCLDGPPRRSAAPAGGQFTAEQAEPAAAATAAANIEIGDADASALDQETVRIVQAALDGLPDRDREVLNLAFRHGFSGADLAEVLGVSPRRAHRLLSRASARFEKSAAVAAVLCVGYGWAACPALESFFGWWDSASPPLTPRLRRRLARHVRSCDRCAENRGHQVLGPGLLSAVPLAVPPAWLEQPAAAARLAAEPGAEPSRAAGQPGKLGADDSPAQPGARRGMRRAVLAAAVTIVVLAGAGGLLYKLTAAAAAGPGRTASDVTAGSRGSTPAGTSQATPSQAPTSPARHHVLAPLPEVPGLSPPPVGVLPVPPPKQSPRPPSLSPSPSPTHRSKSPSPSPTHHSKSPTPSPTTPTPTPTPTLTPTPTPTSTPTPTPS